MNKGKTKMKKSKKNKQKMNSAIFKWVYQNGVQVSGKDSEYKTYLKNSYMIAHPGICTENK